jgi:hydroxyacylglutathione hydrolase
MPLTLVTIPCLTDNYAFLIRNETTGEVALIDAPEAAPIQAELAKRGWHLTTILITHHHSDHVDGVAALRGGATVIGAAADAHRLPPLDQTVQPEDRITICGEPCDVIEVYGHTVGHVAFSFPDSRLCFTADSLMALGCGRLFEGTPAQMMAGIARLADLPGDTLICSGHEYTAANGRFALAVDPQNGALQDRVAEVARRRAAGLPTVPSTLSEERATNPYLRAHLPQVKAALGLAGAGDLAAFTEIRARKDHFRG